MLKGLLAELDENGNTKEGGVQVEGAVMMPTYMKNDDQKAIFNGAKVNTVLVFNSITTKLNSLLFLKLRKKMSLTTKATSASRLRKSLV